MPATWAQAVADEGMFSALSRCLASSIIILAAAVNAQCSPETQLQPRARDGRATAGREPRRSATGSERPRIPSQHLPGL